MGLNHLNSLLVVFSVFFFLLFFIVGVLSFLCFLFIVKFLYNREKYSVFECGFDLLRPLRLPFSLHFYIISIIFLIFDVELVFLLPFVYVFKFSEFFSIYIFLFFFFFFLVVGFFFEWWGGFLGWIF